MARLPNIDGDLGNWGTLLNSYLGVAHNSDGTLKNSDVTLPTGALAHTFPRTFTTADSGALLTSGTLYLLTMPLIVGQVVSTITFISGSTALSTGSNQWFALYSAARAKLQVTNDDTSAAWAANTTKTLTLASSYTVPASGLYYLGITVVATTPPSLRSATTSSGIATVPPILAGSSTGSLTNPASAPTTAAAITPAVAIPYAYVS